MSLVAIVLAWTAYSFVCVGWDRLHSGVGPIKPLLWPTGPGGQNLHVPSTGGTPTAAASTTIPPAIAATGKSSGPSGSLGG
jgi:hypothetical protein